MKFILSAALAAQVMLFAQTLAFEAASIKPLPPSLDGVHVHMSDDDKMVNYSSVGLKDVLAYAYGVRNDQISGPSWLDDQMYAIVAKVPAGSTGKQIPVMLQTLLRERFALVMHRESREIPIFALTVGKGGAKLNMVDAVTGCHGTGDSTRHLLACQTSLAHFADTLSRQMGRPVIDKTLLDGAFAINLQWVPDGPDDLPGTALLEAIPKQLGLKLEAQHAPADFIVVDSANRVPTEN